jgi:hypothetical protein
MNINELRALVKQTIKESSLSRVHQHISQHECAIITAFRGDATDGAMCNGNVSPSSYHSDAQSTEDINKLNNRDLKAILLYYRYGVTAVDGTYVEDFGTEIANEVKEDSLFVINLFDDPSFAQHIQSLGQHYCQDSVMIIPQGGKEAYFVGTNMSEFPGFEQTSILGDITYGRESQFMTKVSNRPMTTNLDENLQTYDKLPRLQKIAVSAIAKRIK